MFPLDQYELLDFGRGRKLERFGATVVDRPCPAADGLEPVAQRWEAEALFQRGSGRNDEGSWKRRASLPAEWTITHGEFHLQLKPTPFGHVGVFPEQAPNWDWLDKRIRSAGRPLKVLNLFAYTGGSTLAAAAAGAEVTHVDASKSVVRWARGNAAASGLEDAPIRWIHEDALKFVQREIKRGRRYDGVILDPPSYGHGPNGEPWKISRDLPALLEACAAVTAEQRQLMLLTCHSPGYGPAEVEALLADCVFGTCQCNAQASRLTLSASGRKLDCGVVARWPGAT